MLGLLLAIFLSSSARAYWNFAGDASLSGVSRNFPQSNTRYRHLTEGYLESTAGGKYSSDDFTFEGKLLLRSIESPANASPHDRSYADLTTPRRFFRLGGGASGGSQQSYLDAGTLWVGKSWGNWQFSAGRKPLGIGVLKVIPVWNRLYPVLPTVGGYMFMNNPDLVDARWQKDSWTFATFAVMAQQVNKQIFASEAIHYGERLESHFLLSYWWRQPIAGYSGVVDWGGATWRLESLFIASGQERPAGSQAGLGWEKALNEKISVLAEYYHSSFGASDKADYLSQRATPFRTLLSSDYVYPQLIYKPSDFTSTQLGALMNARDGSMLAVGEITYSLRDNLDLFGNLRWPLGGRNQEFGYLVSPVSSALRYEFVRWVSAGLKTAF